MINASRYLRCNKTQLRLHSSVIRTNKAITYNSLTMRLCGVHDYLVQVLGNSLEQSCRVWSLLTQSIPSAVIADSQMIYNSMQGKRDMTSITYFSTAADKEAYVINTLCSRNGWVRSGQF